MRAVKTGHCQVYIHILIAMIDHSVKIEHGLVTCKCQVAVCIAVQVNTLEERHKLNHANRVWQNTRSIAESPMVYVKPARLPGFIRSNPDFERFYRTKCLSARMPDILGKMSKFFISFEEKTPNSSLILKLTRVKYVSIFGLLFIHSML